MTHSLISFPSFVCFCWVFLCIFNYYFLGFSTHKNWDEVIHLVTKPLSLTWKQTQIYDHLNIFNINISDPDPVNILSSTYYVRGLYIALVYIYNMLPFHPLIKFYTQELRTTHTKAQYEFRQWTSLYFFLLNSALFTRRHGNPIPVALYSHVIGFLGGGVRVVVNSWGFSGVLVVAAFLEEVVLCVVWWLLEVTVGGNDEKMGCDNLSERVKFVTLYGHFWLRATL